MATTIVLRVPGASADQVARGIAAALAAFEAEGVTPERARQGLEAHAAWNASDNPLNLPPRADVEAWIAYDFAMYSAILACLEGRDIDYELCHFEIVVGLPAQVTQHVADRNRS